MRRTVSIAAMVFGALVFAQGSAVAALPEFLPGGSGTKFTEKSGKFGWQMKGAARFLCEKTEILEGSGELTGTSTALFIMDVTGCKGPGFEIHSIGDASGVVVMHIEAKLCYISKSTKHVGLVLELLPVTIEFVGGTLLEWTGSFITLMEPINKKLLQYKLHVEQKEAVQSIEKCEGEVARTVVTSTNGGEPVRTGFELQEPTITFLKEEQTLMA